MATPTTQTMSLSATIQKALEIAKEAGYRQTTLDLLENGECALEGADFLLSIYKRNGLEAVKRAEGTVRRACLAE